jgi:hypothetical protein
VDARHVQELRAKDVADAGDHRLVEQQGADRSTARMDHCPGDLWIGVIPQRIRPEAADDLVPKRLVAELTHERGDQIGSSSLGNHAQPHGCSRSGWR